MLILQRKIGESLLIGENVTVSVVAVENGRVRLAIDAPSEVSILRSELLAAREVNRESVVENPSAVSDALQELLEDVREHKAHKP